jgi:hypothetical protein
MECRFCFEDGNLISPCKCNGSHKWIHEGCLKKWYEMKRENHICSVCKYHFKVKQLGCVEFVPPCLDIYTCNLVYHTLLEVLVNLTFYSCIDWIPYSAYQLLYLLCYYTFVYFRYYSLIRNKEQYWAMLDDEAKNLVGIQVVAICGLLFVQNDVYHYSAVLLATYVRQPVLYFHYRALQVINTRLDYRFIGPSEERSIGPSEEPTSSS